MRLVGLISRRTKEYFFGQPFMQSVYTNVIFCVLLLKFNTVQVQEHFLVFS